MAFVGLSNPYIAKLVDEAAKKYAGCFACGKAITLDITPNYNEAKLFANNQLAEMAKEFKDGSISLGTDRLPVEALEVCFGHEVNSEKNEVIYRTSDDGNAVGVGFYVDEMISGRRQYVATIVYKVKFSEAANNFTTKGETVEFKTPSIEGTIAGLESGEWKKTRTFEKSPDADRWLREVLGYEEKTPNPPAVDDSEEPTNPSETTGSGEQEDLPDVAE